MRTPGGSLQKSEVELSMKQRSRGNSKVQVQRLLDDRWHCRYRSGKTVRQSGMGSGKSLEMPAVEEKTGKNGKTKKTGQILQDSRQAEDGRSSMRMVRIKMMKIR
ncbi:hypothetical protein NHX12_010452 [Muraenolepis orangiensis]|uniref:Uncharacterized protein n=1 Tax=Muraenolepis orangiensis TaxID=630683 RepID=A0A9Q0DN57_9TELE|nr:hypothetical protein NHX12_010452 [Muraenolepis orangiensis]